MSKRTPTIRLDAWLLSRVATSRIDRAWTQFAMTHTLGLLEVATEDALLKQETDPQGWKSGGSLPPQDATFASALRACSYFKGVAPGDHATARVEFFLDPEQLTCYEVTLERLRELGARNRAAGDARPHESALRACSYFKGVAPGGDATALVEFLPAFDEALLNDDPCDRDTDAAV